MEPLGQSLSFGSFKANRSAVFTSSPSQMPSKATRPHDHWRFWCFVCVFSWFCTMFGPVLHVFIAFSPRFEAFFFTFGLSRCKQSPRRPPSQRRGSRAGSPASWLQGVQSDPTENRGETMGNAPVFHGFSWFSLVFFEGISPSKHGFVHDSPCFEALGRPLQAHGPSASKPSTSSAARLTSDGSF